MTPTDYEFYRRLLIQSSGIHIDEDRLYLLESRLKTISQSLGYRSVEELTLELRRVTNPTLVRSVVEAMTTNETSFFRDQRPFTTLKEDVLPRFYEQNKIGRSLRIWSAASSSGQEAYSIAMTLDSMPVFDDWSVKIIGTDISAKMVKQASEGLYNQFEIQRGLTIQLMLKYFTQKDTGWQISDRLRQKVEYLEGNLMEDNYNIGKFDLIFCRNVLIYFQPETRIRVLHMLMSHLNYNGLIVLGVSEAIADLKLPLETYNKNQGFYQLKALTLD